MRRSIEKNTAEASTYATNPKNKSPPEGGEGEVKRATTSPSSLFLLPKAKQPSKMKVS
jgi:hypothetical protein